MKKLLAILLLLFYLPAISGVAISSHFCCGKIASVKIQLEAKKCDNHSSGKDNCCDDITHFFKIHAPQEASVNNITCKASELQIPMLTSMLDFITLSNEQEPSLNFIFLHSPPPRTIQPLFVQNASFLI